MKKLITTNISGTVKQPIRKVTLDHLQEAHQEVIDALVKSLSPDPSVPFILFGCKNTGSGSNYIISAGAVYYAGEVYLTDAATFTISGVNVAVGVVDITYSSSDPTTLTDGNSYSVHAIRKIKWQAGTSGSGIGTNFVNLKYKIQKDYSQRKKTTPAVSPAATGTLSYTSVLTFDALSAPVKDVFIKVGFEVTTSNGGAGAHATAGLGVKVNGVLLAGNNVTSTIIHKDFFLANFTYHIQLCLKLTDALAKDDVVEVMFGAAATFTPPFVVDVVHAEMTGEVV